MSKSVSASSILLFVGQLFISNSGEPGKNASRSTTMTKPTAHFLRAGLQQKKARIGIAAARLSYLCVAWVS
jgi:hypothetical protein